MPIPKPRSDESNDDFIDGCMADTTMTEEYSVNERLAVSLKSLEDKTDVVEDEKHVISVSETENSYLVEYAKDTEEEGEYEDDEKHTEHIEVTSEIKAEDVEKEDGTFIGYGSIFNNTDLGNDVVEKGAFTKSLGKSGPRGVKMLFQHKTDMPIGVFESIEEDSRGLKVKGRLALKTQAGREAYELLKMGAIDGLSIGFRVKPEGQKYDAKAKKRYIKEVELMEISLVTFPMNPRARVRSVKGDELSIREWENGLRDVFHLSRSEAKAAARAVHDIFSQCDAELKSVTVSAVASLTEKLIHLKE